MSDNRPTLEVIAPTIEEAIEKGLNDLGISEDAVDIEVLDEGSKGLFGIGSRQARVRLTIKTPAGEADVQAPTPRRERAKRTAKPPADQSPIESQEAVTVTVPEEEVSPAATTAEEDDIALYVARETVSELLERMNVHANVEAYYGEADDLRNRIPIHVDVSGDDLSILIGRQAEILNAVQYISGLIVGKELGRGITLIVDVEGYRKRREQQLRTLARRMAEQAIKTGRRQVLEPMPANERRIIHIELRDELEVKTESIGEEPRRKVTISPR